MSRITYRISALADRDLEDIGDWIAQDNPEAAEQVLGALLATFQVLAEFPAIGAIRNDLGQNIRLIQGKRPAHNYVIVFRPGADFFEIVRVLHGARDFSRGLPP